LLRRRLGRLLGAIVGVALTVALLASIGAFTISSAASMTERAIAFSFASKNKFRTILRRFSDR